MREERGQGTIEYLAMVLVVAAVMAAAVTLLATTGLGGQVMDAFRRALCVVTGGACGRTAELASGPCVLASEQQENGNEVTISVVRVGKRDVVLREERSDGTVALTLVDGDSIGLELGVGAGVRVRWGSFSMAAGSELRAAVLAGSDEGRTWIVDDAAAAGQLERLRLARAIPSALDKMDPDVTFRERSGALDLDFGLGNRYTASLSVQDAYGERIDHATGRRTVYVRDRFAGRGKASFGRRVSVAGEGDSEERIAITYDRGGRPVELMVLSTVAAEGAAGLPPQLARIAGYLRIPLRGAKHIETEQRLDLTDPANAEIAQAYLGDLGDGRLGIRVTAKALRERLAEYGTVNVRTYATDADVREVGANAKAGPIALGGSVGSEKRMARLVAAVARRPDGTWGEDPACRPT